MAYVLRATVQSAACEPGPSKEDAGGSGSQGVCPGRARRLLLCVVTRNSRRTSLRITLLPVATAWAPANPVQHALPPLALQRLPVSSPALSVCLLTLAPDAVLTAARAVGPLQSPRAAHRFASGRKVLSDILSDLEATCDAPGSDPLLLAVRFQRPSGWGWLLACSTGPCAADRASEACGGESQNARIYNSRPQQYGTA